MSTIGVKVGLYLVRGRFGRNVRRCRHLLGGAILWSGHVLLFTRLFFWRFG
jgi:hypothetical protein